LNTLVNFESALPSINGQFSVGVNIATGIDDEKFGHIAVQENGKATNSRLGLDGPIKRVRLSTEFYLDSLRKVHTCHSDDIDHHLFMFEQAEKLRVQEVGKLCSEYSNGRQTS
jgi:hypothetical protein